MIEFTIELLIRLEGPCTKVHVFVKVKRKRKIKCNEIKRNKTTGSVNVRIRTKFINLSGKLVTS